MEVAVAEDPGLGKRFPGQEPEEFAPAGLFGGGDLLPEETGDGVGEKEFQFPGEFILVEGWVEGGSRGDPVLHLQDQVHRFPVKGEGVAGADCFLEQEVPAVLD